MKKRLDEILIDKGLITETEVRDALLHQKAHGGRFGSMLLYYRHIDEEKLVDALSAQLGCEGVVISKIDIPESVARMIPAKVALARQVMPFAYDAGRNELKVACLDPTDHVLMKELGFVARGKEIKAYIAAEIALDTVIARFYLGQNRSLDENLLLDIPDDATILQEPGGTSADGGSIAEAGAVPTVLLVTDEGFSGPLLQAVLERDNIEVAVTDSPGSVAELARSQEFRKVLVKESLLETPADRKDLAERLRAVSPKAQVHFYDKASSLVLEGTRESDHDLLQGNLDLFTSLLSSIARCPTNHTSQVGRYAHRLCRRLGLPERESAIISCAAYVHDIARYYYGIADGDDARETVGLTVRLLASMNYPPEVADILRATYTSLDPGFSDRLSLAALGGSIVTAVDLYCHATSGQRPMSLDRLDALKRKLNDLVDKILLQDVVRVFIELIQEEALDLHLGHKGLQTMIYAEDPTIGQPLEMRLRNEGFRTVLETSAPSVVELCKRSQPDIIVLAAPATTETVVSIAGSLASQGAKTFDVPIIVVADEKSAPAFTGLLGSKIEDVIVLEENLDLLVQKAKKVALTIRERGETSGGATTPAGPLSSGMSGRLADMNLVDLIQALGLGRKTVRIAVHSDSEDGGTLNVFLRDGALVCAALGDLVGADAVYEGMAWGTGSWTVEPVSPEQIPEPNNTESNEAILMEGCRLIDERAKAGHLL